MRFIMKSGNIVLLVEIIGIVIGLIGMVLFINHVIDKDKSKHYEQYIHYAYDVNGYNTTDLGYNNEISAKSDGSNSFTIAGNVAAEGRAIWKGD